jgi:predicted PurR-regulated permease PerM|tara:strand:+ start:94 stop:1224 length:1131 start_codon:yes stop_codon:yes gene_type:complete
MQQPGNLNASLEKVAKVSFYVFIGIVVCFGLYLVRGALFPLVLGIVLTYILNPFVNFFEQFIPLKSTKPKLARACSITIVTLIAFLITAGCLLLVVPPMFKQSSELVTNIPSLITDARTTVESWNKEYASNIPEEVRVEIDRLLENGGQILLGAFSGLVGRTAVAAVHALTLVVGLVVLPLFVFYFLKDRETVRESFVEVFPTDTQIHVVYVLRILNRIIGAYVRAQFTLAAVVWVFISIGLMLLGVKYAVLLGAVAGIFELVPIVGAWLAVIPTIIVVLSTSPEKIVWVLLLYLGVQLFQGAIIVPRVQSFAMKLHPLMILISIVVGSEIAGLWGVVLGPPVAASIKELLIYFNNPPRYGISMEDDEVLEKELEN